MESNIERRAWEASYYNGEDTKSQNVNLYLEPGGIRIQKEGGNSEWWAYDAIIHSQGFHIGEPIHLENRSEPFKTIVIDKPDFIESLKANSQHNSSRFKLQLSKSKLVNLGILAAVGVLIIFPTIYFWVLPKFSEFTASYIPIGWEEELGEAYVEILAPDQTLCNNEEFHNYFNDVLDILLSTNPESSYTYNLRIVNDTVVNAYALPGGYIIVYRGLIEKMNSPEEIAGVLAHEIQHVEQKHSMKSLVHQLSFKVIIAMMVGDSEGVGQFLETAGLLGTLDYGREAERSADRAGMEMLHNAKIDPIGMVNFFRTIEEEYGDLPGGLQYFSTHPRTQDRIEYLEKLSKQKTYDSIILDKGISWKDFKKTCSYSHEEIEEYKL